MVLASHEYMDYDDEEDEPVIGAIGVPMPNDPFGIELLLEDRDDPTWSVAT